MSARRFYVSALPAGGGEVALDPGAIKHARVLRLAAGEEVVLFDGRGHEARGVIDLEHGRCTIAAPMRVATITPRLVLCQCVPKGSKLDDIARASTEVGVTAIHLAESERSVPRADPTRVDKQLARLERIVQEAARQSMRADVPAIVAPASLGEVIDRAPPEVLRLAFSPEGAPLVIDRAEEAWILVGPEGGLTPGELDHARAAGFRVVRVDGPVMRVETAAPVLLALVRHAMR